MSGFPSRPTLPAFGPEHPRDALASTDAETEFGAAQLRILKWQAAGLGLVAPVSFVAARHDGSSFTTLVRREGWNPKAETSLAPTVARSSTGVYTVTYAATYPDETGAATALVVLADLCEVAAQARNGEGARYCTWDVASNVVTVRHYNSSGNLADGGWVLRVH